MPLANVILLHHAKFDVKGISMKRLSLAIASLILAGCATTASSPNTTQKTRKPSKDLAKTSAPIQQKTTVSVKDTLDDKKVCLVILNTTTGKVEHSINPRNCQDQLPATSTFKVALAVMGFESNLINDQDSTKKWNGQQYSVKAWNQDQNAQSWISNSTIWYSQQLAWQLGEEKINRYLKVFAYGNQDFSGGLDTAWLTPAPYLKQRYGFSLTISGMQQAEFFKKLQLNKLAVSTEAQQFAKRLIYLQTTPSGFSFSGKTGSGFTDARYKRRIGWFAGTVTKADQQYVVVSNYVDTVDRPVVGEFGAQFAKDLAIAELKRYQLW